MESATLEIVITSSTVNRLSPPPFSDTCGFKNLIFEFGKFDRHWGPGRNSILISNKPPSYPQLGFTWHIIPALEFTYFHGFLKSQIPDSIRSDTYEGIGKRSFDLARSIVGHRMEWTPFPNFTIGATESVVYGSRQIDVHYLLPFTSLWHMENHLGDMDNVQVAIDLAWIVNQNTKLHFSLYIDEWTPEWTFKENDHNWFAYQTGFIWGNLIKKLDILKFEYTWTDHRVYRHRFSINDYYSHGYPLGFWAGPHAEDYFIEYNSSFTWINFILKYTNTKRGQLTHQMLYDQYSDLSYERFSGEFGYEHRMMIELLIHHYFVNQLELQYGLEYIDWRNAGFDPFQPELNTGTDLTKWSFFCNVFYNF